MIGAVWLCVSALLVAVPSWAFPSGASTTCEQFGQGTSFDPLQAVGEWTTVYSWTGAIGNVTEKITIRKLTSAELEENSELVNNYYESKLKLAFLIHDSSPMVVDVNSILVPQGEGGNADAFVTLIKIRDTVFPVPKYTPYSVSWKSVDEFLAIMLCNNQKVYLLSKTGSTPDETKLQEAAQSLNIKGVTGGRIYSSLLSLL